MKIERVIIIRDKTRLEQLVERFNSVAQAKFYLESNNQSFSVVEEEHLTFNNSLKTIQKGITKYYRFKVIFREFISTYIFSDFDLVVVIGQDGLVANTAKYVSNHPIVAINPDEKAYDGILLPFAPKEIEDVVKKVAKDSFTVKRITLAEAVFDDGQRLLAFNDFFIGAATHVSAKYEIRIGEKVENQSSSGILVSTGAGFTGWMSSVFNMARNISVSQGIAQCINPHLRMESEKLLFVVREPFQSKTTQTNMGFGEITKHNSLRIVSKMVTNGVVFSDGMESDFVSFNTGANVTIGVADEKVLLVIG